MSNKKHLPDATSSDFAESFRGQYTDYLQHEITRERVNSIIADFVGSVEFMKKIREYAGMELDSRMFRSTQYWITTILTALVTSGIGVLLGMLVSKK